MTAYAQHVVSGKVVDEQSGEALPFVNILFNNKSNQGVSSDIDGFFSYDCSEPIRLLSCSYVGYEDLQITFAKDASLDQLEIELVPSSVGLAEVVVVAGENPAHRIIKLAVKNKKTNNPRYLPTFEYHAYNKSTTSILTRESLSEKSDLGFFRSTDSSLNVLITEAVVKRQYKAPNLNKEVVIGNRISGLQNPYFTLVPIDIEPFSLYDDIVDLGDVKYTNPISKGSTTKYFFDIRDTLFLSDDSVYVIAYRPLKGKNFDALEGVVYINTDGYAIQNIIARPKDKGFLDFSIQQSFERIDREHWFPVEFNFELIQSFRIDSVPRAVKIKNRYSISNIKFGLDLSPRDFEEIDVIIDDSASVRSSSFWDVYRPEKLSEEDERTYQIIDSIGQAIKLDDILFAVNKVVLDGLVPIRKVDIALSKVFAFNDYEKFRLGLGLRTNERLNPHWSFGAFGGYGLEDRKWKYGGEVMFRGDKIKDIEARLGYQNELRGIGQSILTDFYGGTRWSTVGTDRLDLIKQFYSSFKYRPLRYTQLRVSISNTDFTPLRGFDMDEPLPDISNAYTNTEAIIGIRFAYREKLIQSFDRIVSLDSKYPVLTVGWGKGFDGLLGGQQDYNKLEFRIEQNFYWKYWGRTRIGLSGGLIDKAVPVGLMFSGEGSNLVYNNQSSFRTADPYEFLSDQFFSVFFKHDFKDLLLKVGNFKPHIGLVHNMGWGTIKHYEKLASLEDYSTKERGYYEAGVEIDNVIRISVLGAAYLGIGGGFYYRYGPYAHDRSSDNVTFRFRMDWTSN